MAGTSDDKSRGFDKTMKLYFSLKTRNYIHTFQCGVDLAFNHSFKPISVEWQSDLEAISLTTSQEVGQSLEVTGTITYAKAISRSYDCKEFLIMTGSDCEEL